MTAASLVSEPVCDWAPRAPAWLAPAASTTTGVPASTAAASRRDEAAAVEEVLDVDRDRRGAGSAAQAVTSSTRVTSAWLPSETNREMPRPRAASSRSSSMARLPLWLSSATSPGANALEDR